MKIELFKNWLNEGITSSEVKGIVEKTIPLVEAWAKAKNLKVDVSQHFGLGVTFYVRTIIGNLMLALEEAETKGGMDSYSYHQKYNTKDGVFKWNISYGKANRYDRNSNKKTGNLKTFMAFVEKFQPICQVISKVEIFLKMIDKSFDEKIKYMSDRTTFGGKNLKEVYSETRLGNGEFYYYSERDGKKDSFDCRYFNAPNDSNLTTGTNKIIKAEFDPKTGEIFYYAYLSGIKIEDRDEKIVSVLEFLKDKPVDDVWNIIKDGDWKKIIDKYRGVLASKNYNI